MSKMKYSIVCLGLVLATAVSFANEKNAPAVKPAEAPAKPVVAPAVPTTGKLKITPVSISVVGLSQVEFQIKGGVPPYQYVATSGSLSKGKNKATLFTPEYETTIHMTVYDSKGEKATAEVFVTKPHKED